MVIKQFVLVIYSNWWFQPLWKLLVSWDDDIPNIWKNNPNVPNHQPDNNNNNFHGHRWSFNNKNNNNPLIWPDEPHMVNFYPIMSHDNDHM